MKFETIEDLIGLLEKFPKHAKLMTELSLLWDYPDSLKEEKELFSEGVFNQMTMHEACRVAIFEGSWSKNNVSNVDGCLEEILKKH